MNYIIEHKKNIFNPESIMFRIYFNPINLNTVERTSGNVVSNLYSSIISCDRLPLGMEGCRMKRPSGVDHDGLMDQRHR